MLVVSSSADHTYTLAKEANVTRHGSQLGLHWMFDTVKPGARSVADMGNASDSVRTYERLADALTAEPVRARSYG